MTAVDSLAYHLRETFELPQPAIDWLLLIWSAIQTFDDFADGDNVERADLDALIWNTLVALPCHPFFAANAQALGGAVSTAILKWQASDKAERDGLADARSFVWRAGFYDVVLVVLNLCYGPSVAQSKAHLVMHLYGERLDDYLKEFDHARAG
jgi:hypothetical protein